MDNEIWLFKDRPDAADDNAEHFYEYIRDNHPEIKPYFTIKKSSKDWERLQKKGFNLVDYLSSAYNEIHAKADFIISSQMYPRYMKTSSKQVSVFLQHGICATNLADYFNKKTEVDYATSSVKGEYDAFCDKQYGYKWEPEAFVLTGLARHDALYNLNQGKGKTKKILIDFTWRQNLQSCKSEQIFKSSFYYCFINTLLNSKELVSLLSKYGYSATFKLHPCAEKFKKYFTLGKGISFADDKTSFQTLFVTHDLLVTDYSSIAFDMSYLNKPVIYYQPDCDIMLGGGVNQWEKGWFDYNRDGCGPAVYDLIRCLEEIESMLKNNCEVEPKYQERIDKLFLYRDDKNCERIYNAIKKGKRLSVKKQEVKQIYNPKGHDAVFVLGTKSLNGKNEEIQVAVASLRKYCTSWLKRIYVVGENPNIEGVIHIPAKDIYTHDKDANIIHKVQVACEKIKDLSDDFLMCSDDQLVTKESKFEDFKPRYLEIYDPEKPYWKAKSRSTLWAKRLCMTMERFGKGARYFEPHIFSPMNKKKFLAMCKAYNYKIENGITIFSLYYNFIGEKGVPHFDHYSVQKPPYEIPDNVRCIGYFDSAFKNDTFRRKLNEITGADIEVATVPEGKKNRQTYKKASTPQETLIEPMITNKLGQLKMNGATKTAQAMIVETKSKRPNKRAVPISDVMQLETMMLLRQANNLEKKKKSVNSNPITQKRKNVSKETPETAQLKKDYAKYGFRGWTNNM